MGLYNISAMAAILDMQISWFSNSNKEIHQRVHIDLRYTNWPMAAILNMQISWFFKKIAKIWGILETAECLCRSWICKIAHGGYVEYANYLIFQLRQDNPSEGVKKKNREDRINIGDWRAFTSIIDDGYANWPIAAILYANKLIFEIKKENPPESVQKKIRKDRINIGDWRAFTSSNCWIIIIIIITKIDSTKTISLHHIVGGDLINN